jgi:uncharacterized protein YndB with AHSA1/START domain
MASKQKMPVGETGMLIRKPIDQTFEAFTNPEITAKFWFTKSTGRGKPGPGWNGPSNQWIKTPRL